MKKISILIPCYNEEQSLPVLYNALNEVTDTISMYEWEYLFVNDGSRDNTMQWLEKAHMLDSRVNYIDLSRNFGKENAMLAGFDYVSGDAVIIMDADLQDPPSLIPDLLLEWEHGYDDVYARRADRGKEPLSRKWLSLLYYKLLDSYTNFDILQNVGDFRLLDRKCINALRQLRESERYTKGLFCWIGYNKKEILFDRGDSVRAKSNWSYISLLNLAINGLTSFTTAPLRMASILGFVMAVGAFVYGLWFFVKTLSVGDPVAGFPTLIIVILFLGGLILLSIGIIGEYVGKVYNEVKRRPVYLVKSYNGISIL